MISLRSAVLLLTVAACGGDDGATLPDARLGPVYTYDLSCLGMKPATVDPTIHVRGFMADQTFAGDWPSVATANVRIESLDGTTMLGSDLTADDGIFEIDISTNSMLTPVRVVAEHADFKKQFFYGNRAPWRSQVDGDIGFFPSRYPRMEAMALALDQGVDDTKGFIEVWLSDCGWQPMPGATLHITEEPDLQWVNWAGAGVWLPGMTTPRGLQGRSESVAGAVNVTPGVKHLSVEADGQTIGTVELTVEANAFHTIVVMPGYVPRGPGF
jgi:hypothetical protein